MAGVTTGPRGWYPYAQAHLFVFPPPLVGVELRDECGSCSFSEGACDSAGA
jgi:hypothetical protein